MHKDSHLNRAGIEQETLWSEDKDLAPNMAAQLLDYDLETQLLPRNIVCEKGGGRRKGWAKGRVQDLQT